MLVGLVASMCRTVSLAAVHVYAYLTAMPCCVYWARCQFIPPPTIRLPALAAGRPYHATWLPANLCGHCHA